MRRAVDEVGPPDERGGQAYHGAVEPDDQDLGVVGEYMRDVEVEGDKGLEPELVGFGGGGGCFAGDGDVCASVEC